jgi:hypothetical protein
LSDFEDIFKEYISPKDTENTEDLLVKKVKNWLKECSHESKRWLLVFDNVDISGSSLSMFLPTQGSGHIIATSREEGGWLTVFQGAEFIKVEEMDTDEAVELFRKHAYIHRNCMDRDESINQLVEELGFLPLAIELAGAYIRFVDKGVDKFLVDYRKNRKIQLGKTIDPTQIALMIY